MGLNPAPRRLRILALLPDAGGSRVAFGPEPLLRALPPEVDLGIVRIPPAVGGPMRIEEMVEVAFGTASVSVDWLFLADHDQPGWLPRDLASCGIPRAVWMDDTFTAPVERIRWLRGVQPRLACVTQWRGAAPYAWHIEGRVLWLPHGVDAELFAPSRDDASRDVDLLLFGAMDRRVYPFRYRIARLLDRFKDLQVARMPHPGYASRAANADGAGAIAAQSALAAALSRSKLAFVDGTRRSLLLLRYLEVPAAGAEALGPIPGDHADILDPLVTPLDPTSTDAELERAIRGRLEGWLERAHERAARRAMIVEQHSWRNRGARLARALREELPETAERAEA